MIIIFIILDVIFNTYNIEEKLIDDGFSKIEEREHLLNDKIGVPEDILLSIRNSKPFNYYLKNPTMHQFSLNDIFLILVKQNSNIMQLRYLNVEGIEKIRVDRKNRVNEKY